MMSSVVAFAAFALSLAFAASPLLVPGFGGFDPDQFPIPQVNPPVQPAGYAFAIWGLIYAWLIISLGFGLLQRRLDPGWNAMRLPLCLSLAVGTVWLPVAMASPIWASILIWVMLLSALAALFQAPRSDLWLAAYPVGLYAGWLSAASCVSLGLLAAGYGWMSQTTAAYLFIGLAILLAVVIQTRLTQVPTYGLAVIWAFAAVTVRNFGAAPGVALIAAAGAATLMVITRKSRPD